jgi:hypothetical protein
MRRLAATFLLLILLLLGAADSKVVFNVHSRKYHCPKCSAARACTRNCIDTTLSYALQHGGVACKLCGGTCTH